MAQHSLSPRVMDVFSPRGYLCLVLTGCYEEVEQCGRGGENLPSLNESPTLC